MANPRVVVDVIMDALKLKRGAKESEEAVSRLDKILDKLGKGKGKTFDALSASAKDLAKDKLGPLGDTASKVGIDLDDLNVKAAAAGAAVAAMGAFVAGGLVKLKGLTAEVRQYRDAAKLSWEEASKLNAVFQDFGISAEDGIDALKTLGEEAGDAPEKFQRFGIEIAKANNGSVDLTKTLQNTAEKFRMVQDPAERAAMGAALFGDNWLRIAPVLEQGGAGLEKLIDGVDGARVVTEEAAREQIAMEKAMRELDSAVDQLQMSMARELVPTLSLVAQDLAKVAEVSNKVTGETGGFGQVLQFVNPLAQLYSERVKQMRKEADEAAESMKANAESVAAAGIAAVETTRSTEALAASTEASTEATREHTEALDRQATALLGLFSKELAADAARQSFDDTLAELSTATDDYGGSLDDAKGKALSAASAQVELAKQSAAASGSSLDAAQAQTVFRDALVDLSAQVEDPTLRAYLDETIARLNASETAGYGAAGGFNAAADAARRVGQAAAEAVTSLMSAPSAGGGFTTQRSAQSADAALAGPGGFSNQRSGPTFIINSPIGKPDDVVRWMQDEIRKVERGKR